MRETPKHDAYQPLVPSRFGTAFWEFYRTLTGIEAEFDLIYRRDGGVAVWTANRVRNYYDFAAQLGLYNTQETATAPAVETLPPAEIPDPVDLIVQTGAGGPAATNRARGAGCLYTDSTVRRCLELGKRVLVVHDAPELLEQHDGLLSVTFRNFRLWGVEAAKARKVQPHILSEEDEDFWSSVAERFTAELGVTAPDPKRIAALATSHRRSVARHGALLDQLRPNASIMMTHYLRAPQIEAAQQRCIWTIDYQHGIHSRYHMGYGYPGLRTDHRAIPYLPDEHWQWGKAWVSPDWWPAPLKQRMVGHDVPAPPTNQNISFAQRPEKTLLVASSWAMGDDYRRALSVLAQQTPDWTFQIKLHPREKTAQYAELTETFPNVELISGDVDIHTAARKVRYVASICSSALFDVLLDDCRIAVWNLPSVEYAEDLIDAYDIPVLEPDGSNFQDTIKVMAKQNIPPDDLFHSMSAIECSLLEGSLSVPMAFLRRPTLSSSRPNKFRLQSLLWMMAAPIVLRLAGYSSPADLATARDIRDKQVHASPREHYLALRKLLSSDHADSISAPAKIRLMSDAVAGGLPPTMLAAFIRKALKENTIETSKQLKLLLAKVQQTRDLTSAPLRAELLEHALHNNPAPERGPAWKAGASALAGLSLGLAKYVSRYETIIETAHASYPDTRVSAQQREALAQEIAMRLADPAPFSMIRIGDGEAYAFEPDYISERIKDEDRSLRENIWWSNRLAPDKRRFLQSGVQQAIANADLLGIPSIWRLLQDLPRKLAAMRGPIDSWSATARAHFTLSEELVRLADNGKLDWSRKTLLDDRCHQELFTRSGMERFLKSGRPSVLISCFDLSQINAAFDKPTFNQAIRIPPHSKVRHAVPDDTVAKALMPDMMDDLLDQVGQHAKEGAVFFVAGGIAGKLLLDHAKTCGSAALDIGAAADYWMGLNTRGPLDFVQFGQRKDFS